MGERQSAETGTGPDQVEPAEILAPGPILAVVALAIGWAIHLLVPIGGLPSPANYAVGGVLALVGVVIVLSGIRSMGQVDETPFHEEEPTDLRTEGPFAYSRNPLYLGIIVAYLGLTIIIDSVWPLLTLLPLVWYFRALALQEERYLESKFRDEYREYCEDVRRWL